MNNPDWHMIASRLAARLRVHASSTSTGYRQDPRSINDPDAPTEPGMSDRWCVRDQYALADYEAAENNENENENSFRLCIPEELPEDTRTPEEIEEADKEFIAMFIDAMSRSVKENRELRKLRTYEEGERPTPQAGC